MSVFGHLPAAIRWLRIRRRLTQGDLAARAAISRSRLSNFERGTAPPPLPTLDRLLTALDADAAELTAALEAVADAAPQVRRKRYRRPAIAPEAPGRPVDSVAGFARFLEAVATEALQLAKGGRQGAGG